MLPIRRTFFNRLYQPELIGGRRVRRFRRIKWIDPALSSKVQKTRRANQGYRNKIIGRHALLKTLIHYYIKFPLRVRTVSKPFVRRAKLYGTN